MHIQRSRVTLSLHVQMTPEVCSDLEVARLKVTAMSAGACIPDYPQSPPPAPLLSSSLPLLLPVRSGRFISCGNNGERSEPINEVSREQSDGERMDKTGGEKKRSLRSYYLCSQ